MFHSHASAVVRLCLSLTPLIVVGDLVVLVVIIIIIIIIAVAVVVVVVTFMMDAADGRAMAPICLRRN